jgi:hypothetical protein
MNHNLSSGTGVKLVALSPVGVWALRSGLPAIALLLMWISGCSSAPDYHLVPVAGTVLYRDKPVKMVVIQLVPDGPDAKSRISAAGQTDGDGHFTLTSAPHGKGAAPGEYKAFFAGYGANTLPQRYTNPKTGLPVTIPQQGSEDLVLKLAD